MGGSRGVQTASAVREYAMSSLGGQRSRTESSKSTDGRRTRRANEWWRLERERTGEDWRALNIGDDLPRVSGNWLLPVQPPVTHAPASPRARRTILGGEAKRRRLDAIEIWGLCVW